MFGMELFLLAGSAVFIGVLGALTALGWGVLQLVKSHTSAGLFTSPLDWIALASMVGGASLGTALLAPLISPIVVPIIAPIAMAISAAFIGPTIIATVIAAFIGSIAIAAIFVFFIGSPTDDGLQQFFLYQEESSVNLILDHEKQMSFYRVVSYGASDETVHLELSTCMAPNPEASEYDFVGCPDGSYYPLALNEDANDAINNQKASQLKSTAQDADSLLGQLISKVDERLFGTSTDISDLEDQIASHAAKVNHHHNQVRRHHANLRHCAWWDAPCRGHNAWLRGQISYHGYWSDYHSSKRGEKAHQLASLEQEQMQLTRDRQQLVETQSELSAKRQQLEVAQQTSSITHHDDGSFSMADSDLGIGVHWVQDYTTQITSLSDSDGGYQITVDCPLMQKVCETLQLNHDQYPLLWQQGIEPVRLLSDGITSHYDISSNQWRVTVINNGSTDESSSEHGAHNAYSLALYYDYRSGEASGPGSSSDQSQVIQQGVFDYAKYSGALKGRWHRGDMEVDGQEIVRWQRSEDPSGTGVGLLNFDQRPDLLFSNNDQVVIYGRDGIKRLIDVLLIDLNEDGLDDLLSVYSDSSGTTLTYRSLTDVEEHQSRSDERVIADLNAVNIDRVQLIQGTHHVYGKQDGVNYLLLHSKTDSQLYPVALVQPKQTDLTQASIDQLQIASADPVDNALATDAIWLNDPAYGFTAGDQLLLSWVRSGESHGQNKDSLPSVYIDRNQLSVEQRTYALTALEDTNPTGYSFVPASDREGTDATLDMQWNTYGLTRDLPGCELSTTYSYRGHLSLQLINDPQAADNQLGAVVSATNACELVRAMDPYHRGKTDRLLVQNHQQSLNAWSHLDLSHLPQDRFAFYLDYSHGAYQPQGILTQASLEAAAYQYPLSVILQSQHLGTNEPEERNNFITTLSHYCDKQHPGNQNCLVEWIKTAINIDSNESEFAACKQYQALDSEFIDCLRQQTMTRLHSFVGKEIASLETRSHEFTHSYEGSHTIRLRDLSSGKTATIDVEDLFNTMGDRVSIHGMGGEQVSNYDHQRPWLSELTHGVINGLVPRAYAGAEIAACLAAGPAALECAAIDFVATIVVSVFIADNLAKADAENSQSHTSKNEISLSNNAEAGLAMQAAQSIENKHFHFCPNGDSVPVICDQNNPESSKISITQREDHFSILVILNDASPRLLEISTDHPSYHQIRSLYEGGQSQLQALIKNIIDLVQDQKRIAFEVDRKQYAINRNNLEDSYTVAWLRVSDDGAEEKVPLITIGLDHPLYTQTSALFPDPSAAQQASYVDNLINHIVSVQLSQLPEPDDQQTDPLSLQDNQALMNYNWEKQRLDLKFNAHKKHFFFPDSTIGTNVYIHNPRYVDSRYLVGQELTGQQQVLYEYLSQKAQEQSRPMFVTFLGGCLSCMQTAQKGKKKQEQGSIKVNPKDPSETKISVNAANILQKNDRRLCRVLANPDKRRMEQEFYDYHANKAIGCFTIEILPIETEEGLRYTFSKWLNSDSNSEIWAIDCNLNSPHYHIMSFERDFTCTYTYQERKSITIFIVKEKENEDTDESNLPIRLNFQGAFAGNENIIAFKSLEPFGRNIEVLDSALMFKDASRLKVVQMNVDHSVNFELMFGEATNFTGLESNISAWQTENVRDMSQMFHNANHFEGDISDWQTENVIDMSHMFREATVFNSDISAWRTENVRHMSYMFYGTMLFMQDLHLWQVGRVQDHDWFYLQRVRFHDNFRVDDWPENHQPIFPN